MSFQSFDYLKPGTDPDDPGARVGLELDGLVYGASGDFTDEQIRRLCAIDIFRELGLPLVKRNPRGPDDPAVSDIDDGLTVPTHTTLTLEQAVDLFIGLWRYKDRFSAATWAGPRNRYDLELEETDRELRAENARELRKCFRIVRNEPDE
jgi:hypothetical protein